MFYSNESKITQLRQLYIKISSFRGQKQHVINEIIRFSDLLKKHMEQPGKMTDKWGSDYEKNESEISNFLKLTFIDNYIFEIFTEKIPQEITSFFKKAENKLIENPKGIPLVKGLLWAAGFFDPPKLIKISESRIRFFQLVILALKEEGLLENEIGKRNPKVFAKYHLHMTLVGNIGRKETINVLFVEEGALKDFFATLIRNGRSILNGKIILKDSILNIKVSKSLIQKEEQDLYKRKHAIRSDTSFVNSFENVTTLFFNNELMFNKGDSNEIEKSKSKMENPQKIKEVFVTYSWDDENHREKVIAFTNTLRENGYHAEMDELIAQTQTATDFSVMMHRAIEDYQKVIIVLSKGYKEKANEFKRGVGKEYTYIIKQIDNSPQKFILVSFEGIHDGIFPLEFKHRDTIDLSEPHNIELVYRKLQNKPKYEFSEVAVSKPDFKRIKPKDFFSISNEENIAKKADSTLEDKLARLEGLQTGGNAFCYCMLYDFDLNLNIAKSFAIIKKGEFPLYDLRYRVSNVINNKDILNRTHGELNSPADYHLETWDLPEFIYLRVHFFARNGSWNQDLILKKSLAEKCWLAATIVKDRQGKNIVFEHLDTGYEAEFGTPNWMP